MAIVTICRGSRTGGEALATCLAAELGYPVVGREVLQRAAADLSLTESILTDALERAPRLLERDRNERRAYVIAVQAALAEAAAAGDLVYHGLAGQLLLRGLPAVCRVRLIAPLAMRIGFVRERDGLDEAAAETFIRAMDESRARWVRQLYDERIGDPALYDVVLNLEHLDLEAACGLVRAVVRQPEFALTERVRAALGDFVLACRVRVGLLRDPDTRGLPLDVRAEAGRVEVFGSAPVLSSGETGNRVAALARSVPGVEDVRLRFEWFDPYP